MKCAMLHLVCHMIRKKYVDIEISEDKNKSHYDKF